MTVEEFITYIQFRVSVFQVLLTFLFSGSVWLTFQTVTMAQMLRKLLHMHEHPEKTGFGTVGMAAAYEENTRAQERLTRALIDLSHYVKFAAEHPGQPIPPPSPDL